MRRTAAAVIGLTLVASGLVAATLSGAGTDAAPRPAPWATLAFSRSEVVGGGLYLAGRGGPRLLVPGAVEPSWSPDGRRVAYIAPGAGGTGDVFAADADGTHRGRITRTDGVDETSPSWSPDGRHLAVERAGRIVILRADGGGERPVGPGLQPAWSPGGRRIAFTDGDNLYLVSAQGGRARQLTFAEGAQTAPAWAPDGLRLAFVTDESGVPDIHALDLRSGAVTPLTADPAVDGEPAFTANGVNVVFTSNRSGVELLWRMPAAGAGAGPAAPLVTTPFAMSATARPEPPSVVQLLPDLEQRPPADLSVRTVLRGKRRHFLLGFDSATDNVGLGPVVITARRPSRRIPFMRASQVVRLAAGGTRRTFPRVGLLRYVYSPTHSHWHVMGFQRYELRRASDYALLLRDRKSGFCLADHYAHAPGRVLNKPNGPVFKGYCEQGRPEAVAVHQGTSVGYTDRYPSHFHGQNLDLTGVAAGEYILIHRANRSYLFRELRYENNAASLRIKIGWPKGRRARPSLRILSTCPDSDRC
ncbi:MAG: lysyl oxidase family protein [Gaiellaceae bacterium]